jgi:hypothetical protein
MNKREFNAVLKNIADPKTRGFDLAKVQALDDDLKGRMVDYLVRHRGPVLEALIGPRTDRSWLHCCGYLYPATAHGVRYLCTAENRLVIERAATGQPVRTG